MRRLMGAAAAVLAITAAGHAQAARTYVWAAGSSTVFPFATRVLSLIHI